MPEQSPRPQRWFHRHPAIALGGFSVVVVIGFDLILGGLLTSLGINPALHGRDDVFRVRHELFHHALAPQRSAEAEWGPILYPLHTNSLGFKDASTRLVPLRSEAERILLVGDSFTEGIGVPWEDTFAGLLAARLEDEGVEVLNAGVASYSPIIYLRVIEHLLTDVGLEIDQVIVLIDMSDIHDEALSYRFDEDRRVVRDSDREPLVRLDRFIERRTVLMSTIRSLYERIRDRARMRQPDALVGVPTARWAMDDALFEAFGRRGLARASEHMDALNTLLQERGIPLTVVVYPWPDQILEGDLDSRQARHWRDWCAEHDARFLNLFPVFMQGGDARELTSRYFLNGDVHWNHAGHALVADALYTALQR